MKKVTFNSNGLSAEVLIANASKNEETASRLLLGDVLTAYEATVSDKETREIALTITEVYFKASYNKMKEIPRPVVKSLVPQDGYGLHYCFVSEDSDVIQHAAIRVLGNDKEVFFKNLFEGKTTIICTIEHRQYKGTDCATIQFNRMK